MIKIALTGPKGGGKTWIIGEVAKRLDMRLQGLKIPASIPPVSTIAFADPIYDAQFSLFAATRHMDVSGRVFNEWIKGEGLDDVIDPIIGITPRGFRQQYGTEFARKFNEDVWVNIVEEKLNQLDHQVSLAQMVLDLRFPNEWDMLKDREFTLLYINTTGAPEEGSHASESHLLKLKNLSDDQALDKAQANMMVDKITDMLFTEISDNHTTSGLVLKERKLKLIP